MSVKSTVASTRSSTGCGRTPVRNSSISSRASVLVAEPGHVVGARQLDDLRAGDPLADEATGLREDLVGAVEHERRHADGGQDVADVDHRAHARERRRGSRASRAERSPRVSLDELFVVRDRGRQLMQQGPDEVGSPAFEDRALQVLDLLVRRADRVVRRPASPCRAAHHHERPGPLGVGGREQRAHRPALGVAQDGGALHADVVHDGAHVVHAGLERREVVGLDPVGEPDPPLVEEDQARERREPLVETLDRLDLRGGVEALHPAVDEDDVERPLAHDLVGDVDVTVLRVARLPGHALNYGDSGHPGDARGARDSALELGQPPLEKAPLGVRVDELERTAVRLARVFQTVEPA